MLNRPSSLTVSFSDFPPRSYSELRAKHKKFTIPWSETTIKKMAVLAKSDEVLASSKASRNHMHCHDLWDKRMQMEAVKVLMAKNDPRILKHKFEQSKTLSHITQSNPISHRTRTWMRSRPNSPKLNVTWDTLPTLCTAQLSQSCLLKSRLDRAKQAIVRHKATKSVGEEVGLSEFIRDEVLLFRAGAMNNSTLLNKSGVMRLSHKKKVFGIQFYEAQRKKECLSAPAIVIMATEPITPQRSDSGDEDSSPFFASDPKSSRVRFILIEAETNQLIRKRKTKHPFQMDNQMAFIVRNRQFMRKRFRISGEQMRSQDRVARSQSHGLLSTQPSVSAQKTSNYLNILKQKAQTPKMRASNQSLRASESLQHLSFKPSLLIDQTPSPDVSIPSPRLQEILASPSCICLCPRLSVCSCGKRAAVRSFGFQKATTNKDRVDSLILDCEETGGLHTWKRMAWADKRMIKELRDTRRIIKKPH